MNAFADLAAALFADPNIGTDAQWRRGGVGRAVAVRIVLARPDVTLPAGAADISRASVVLDVRASEVAAPAEGDTFETATALYRIAGAPQRCSERLVWRCEAREVRR